VTSDGSGLQPRPAGRGTPEYLQTHPRSDSLADVLERVLDKGIVIVGDIQIRLLDIELLTIKIRLLIVSVDKAQEMGIDWWRNDPMLSTSAQGLAEENRRLRERVEALELESGNLADEEETEEDTEGETEVRAGVPDR
jgi:hypothetical protein